ncbi:class I SAM-dependent DNA methyltransferase, partial [Xanthobacter aminoxidans]
MDAGGLDYGFEVGATKTGGGHGFADVFKRGHFGWEYKGTRANLDAALLQLQRYAVALDNPPLLIVSDIGTTIRIHTNWTNSVSKIYDIPIAELEDAEKRQWLKAAFADPEALRPTKTRQQLTEEVAGKFAELARSLRARYDEPEEVAHFINRLVFCMFAEDVKLLKDGMFSRMLDQALLNPSKFEDFARKLFRAMSKGGTIGFETVAWFNGGLFDSDRVFPLTPAEIRLVHEAAQRFWGDIDPSILGTLFERGLDPDKRSQLGAHYTDRDKIMMIIEPVIIAPLAAEWAEAKAEIAALMEKAAALDATAKTQRGKAGSTAKGQATTALNSAQAVLDRYLKRLADFRVLDPACGSGNFLYLALRALKDLEHRAQVEAEALGLPRRFPAIGPEVVRGIEINPYAAELARVSVWIGEIQWMLKNGFEAAQNPVLKPLENIERRDALLNEDGTRAEWPEANVIVGNPPFLGRAKLNRVLKEDYVAALRSAYANDVPPSSDLVIYWFYKAHELISCGSVETAGFVGTQAIRRGASRKTLDKIVNSGRIFDAWSDQRWAIDGAAVRVSLVCFDRTKEGPAHLDGRQVVRIASDLFATEQIIEPYRLSENIGTGFQGTISGGPFEISGEIARKWISSSGNPNGRPNSDILFPWRNADDLIAAISDTWIIVFPDDMTETEASLYEEPYEYLLSAWEAENTKREREGEKPLRAGEPRSRETWWLLQRSRPALAKAKSNMHRYIATPRVGKFRAFRFLQRNIVPDTRLVIIASDSDCTFGILQSRHHTMWALRYGAKHGVGNDPEYVHTKTFETFPFPEGLAPNIPAAAYADDPRAIAIAKAAARLNELRENWLNPADLVRREPEVVAGYPDRVEPVSPEAEKELKKRTL